MMETKFEADLKCEKVLSLCPNVYFYDKPENSKATEYVRWFILDEQNRAYAGGKPLYREYDIQVDIYTLGSFREISNAIIETLEDKKYTVIKNTNDVVKKGYIKQYHKLLRFRFNEYKKGGI